MQQVQVLPLSNLSPLAQNHPDAGLLQQWLDEYLDSPATHRSYQKEGERFVLWCAITLNKSLAQLTRQDFDTYFCFLDNPTPQAFWCAAKGGRARKRGSPDWRPFAGPLGAQAKALAISAIGSLMRYGVDAGHLVNNPLVLIRRKQRYQQSLDNQQLATQQRILEPIEWQALLQTLESFPESIAHEKDEKERLRFIVAILFLLGLRIAELEKHTWGAFRQVQGRWWFFVLGKGKKHGKIPVNDQLLQHVMRFRMHLGLSALPLPDDALPLIPSWRGDKALGARQMNSLIKQLGERTALRFIDQPHIYKKFMQFSPHWLRHLSASMQDQSGIPFAFIKANHRHENDETTRRYVHFVEDERHDAMQKLKI